MSENKLNEFKTISSSMIWKGAALEQIEAFNALGVRLGADGNPISAHTSKSIKLPVVCFVINGNSFVLRDNFHDVNLLARLKGPSWLSLAGFFKGIKEPKDWDWYLSEIERSRGYSWREWTEEEIDDPRILRVFSGDDHNRMSWAKKPEEKDRWVKRMTDPEWWSKDWSGGELTWDGTFGPGVTIYPQYTPYAEGIPKGYATPEKYVTGSSEFLLALGTLKQAEILIRRLGGIDEAP